MNSAAAADPRCIETPDTEDTAFMKTVTSALCVMMITAEKFLQLLAGRMPSRIGKLCMPSSLSRI
jgi:hypothetical protein